jgi:hypothetical protein
VGLRSELPERNAKITNSDSVPVPMHSDRWSTFSRTRVARRYVSTRLVDDPAGSRLSFPGTAIRATRRYSCGRLPCLSLEGSSIHPRIRLRSCSCDRTRQPETVVDTCPNRPLSRSAASWYGDDGCADCRLAASERAADADVCWRTACGRGVVLVGNAYVARDCTV